MVTITRKTEDLPLVIPNIAVISDAKAVQAPPTPACDAKWRKCAPNALRCVRQILLGWRSSLRSVIAWRP